MIYNLIDMEVGYIVLQVSTNTPESVLAHARATHSLKEAKLDGFVERNAGERYLKETTFPEGVTAKWEKLRVF